MNSLSTLPSPRLTLTSATLLAALTLAACGGANEPSSSPSAPVPAPSATTTPVVDPVTVQLLTHDSFNLSVDVLAAFEADTGITVEILRSGDAGAMLSQAILTKDNPIADVIFGVDNVSLGRALAADILSPHTLPLPADVAPATILDDQLRAVPIDTGDVCLNYDRAAFAALDLAVPTTIADLRDPAYASRLVVEDPSTSSPGLAFMLATIDALGEDQWIDFWKDLRDGDVLITSGWEDAYYGAFSGGSGEGDRPLVVSYASSPPAEVAFGSDPDADEAPTGVILDTCFRQIEFAGTLVGTEHPAEAAALVDFLLSDEVQQDIPLQMFVFPVRDVTLPEVFTKHAQVATSPHTIDPERIEASREDWIQTWVDVMLR